VFHDLLRGILCAIVSGLITALNFVIAGLAAFLQTILDALPPMPDRPGAPSDGALAWLNWIVPLGPLMSTVVSVVTLAVGFLILRVALNWARAL
jgi:hypothetical protein